MITKTGKYINRADGVEHTFTFEVPDTQAEFDGLQLTDAERSKLAHRMFVVDSRNNASAKAQAAAGHNQPVVTAEQKEARKKTGAISRALYAAVQSRLEAGESLEDITASLR